MLPCNKITPESCKVKVVLSCRWWYSTRRKFRRWTRVQHKVGHRARRGSGQLLRDQTTRELSETAVSRYLRRGVREIPDTGEGSWALHLLPGNQRLSEDRTHWVQNFCKVLYTRYMYTIIMFQSTEFSSVFTKK